MSGFIDGVNRIFTMEHSNGSMHINGHSDEVSAACDLMREMQVFRPEQFRARVKVLQRELQRLIRSDAASRGHERRKSRGQG